MAKGWIKLHRSLQDCSIWASSEPYDMRSAWVDLLMLANHEDKDVLFNYKPLTIMRGQYLTSVRQLGARWSWSKNRVLKYLRLLEKLKMIERESDKQRTLLTVVNYGIYQDGRDTGMDTNVDTGVDRPMDTGMPQTSNVKNVKNEKNINIDSHINIYSSSFNEFWEHYPRKQDKGQAYKQYKARLNDGYTEEQLLTACINYAAECENEKREKKYIKVGSTFLSVNEPFVDYLEKGVENEQSERRTAGNSMSDDEIRAILEYAESDEAKREEAEFRASLLRKV